MYVEKYEILCFTTSWIIAATSTYILIITNNNMIIFIILAGTTSYFTRLYRIIEQEYVMNHPLVYADIFSAILAFVSFILYPFDRRVYYQVIGSFILMIIAAIMSWDIFPVNLVKESFYFQSAGHIIISSTLCYLVIFM
jgi:hypothetical protein